jgi:hypothetical protein
MPHKHVLFLFKMIGKKRKWAEINRPFVTFRVICNIRKQKAIVNPHPR